MTEIDIFAAEVQSVAEQGIARMESEMLSSFNSVFTRPDLTGINALAFSVPDIPVIPDFKPLAVYGEDSLNPHTDHVWVASQAADLEKRIFDSLSNGGIGISSALQDALFQSDRERKLQTLADSLTSASAGLGARGFRLPNNMLMSQRTDLIQKYQFDQENQSREITKLMEEHARQNWQFCVERGIGMEQFHAEFASRYDGMFIELKRFAVEKYRAELVAEVERYQATLSGIAHRLDTYRIRNEANMSALNALVEKAKLEVSVATNGADTAIRSYAANVTKQVHAYDAYARLVQGFAQTASSGRLNVTTTKG